MFIGEANEYLIKQVESVVKQINELKKDYKKFNEYFDNADNISDVEFTIEKDGSYKGVCIYLNLNIKGAKVWVDTCKRIGVVRLKSYHNLASRSFDFELKEMLDKKFKELYESVR